MCRETVLVCTDPGVCLEREEMAAREPWGDVKVRSGEMGRIATSVPEG